MRTRSSACRRSISAVVISGIRPTLHPVELAEVFLVPLELDEAVHFLLSRGAQGAVLLEDVVRTIGLVEEVSDAQVEALQDLEQRVETDLVFALLHAGEVGLMYTDFFGELHLRQLALPAELADLASDEFELCGPVHRGLR